MSQNNRVRLIKIPADKKHSLLNLLEKYSYEFSQWDKIDVDGDGMYGYDELDDYFDSEHNFAYFIMADDKIAGFVMIGRILQVPEYASDFCLAEFFILHKYRRTGIGREAAIKAMNLHRGTWQMKRHPHNEPSVRFWDNVIDAYTGGNYRLIENYPNPKVDYDDGTAADVILFDNSL